VIKRAVGPTVQAVVVLWATAGALGAAVTPRIAYVTETNSGPPMGVLANANGSGARILGKGSLPTISPNGQLVSLGTQGGNHPSLLVYSSAGKVVGKFFNGKQVAVGGFAWSADSRYLAVGLTDVNTVNKIGRSGLAIIDTQTDKTYMVAHGMVSGLSWSPSGDSVVFGLSSSPNFSGGWNLYTSGPNTISLDKITTNNNSLNPVWGKLGIAYDQRTNRGKNSSPRYQITLLNGSHLTQITHLKLTFLQDGLVPVAVSANGADMIADFVGEDTSIAYTVNLKTHAVAQVKVGHQSVTPGGISQNGKRVLVVVGGFEQPASAGKVETVPFGGGKATVIVAHGDFPSWNQ
jgi:WD40 repeat protein